MKKLTIAIDIDDTITNTFDFMIPYIAEFYSINLDYLKNNNISYTTLTKEMKEKELEFAQTYFEKVMPNAPIKEDAAKYIKKLKELGHKIIIITARSFLFYTDPYKISEEYLKNNNIIYDEIICSFDKAGKCKEYNVDILIDDSIDNCTAAKKLGITSLLFDCKPNQNNLEHTKVYSWKDVYHYIINEK